MKKIACLVISVLVMIGCATGNRRRDLAYDFDLVLTNKAITILTNRNMVVGRTGAVRMLVREKTKPISANIEPIIFFLSAGSFRSTIANIMVKIGPEV